MSEQTNLYDQTTAPALQFTEETDGLLSYFDNSSQQQEKSTSSAGNKDDIIYRVAKDKTYKRSDKSPYSPITPKESVKVGTEVIIIQQVTSDKTAIVKVREVATKAEYYISSNNLLKKPGDVSDNFDWMDQVVYDDTITQVSKDQLALILKNRKKINDRTDKKTYGKGGQGNKTLDPTGKGYVYYGKDVAQPNPSGNKDDIEYKIKEIIRKELMKEGGYSAINTYDNEKFTWGKGFAITGQVYQVFEELFKSSGYKQLFKNVGMIIVNNKLSIINDQGAILTGSAAENELRVNTQLLSFFIELAEKGKYAKDVATAQSNVFSKNAGKIPAYVMDKEKNDFADSWNKSSVSLLAHLSHWIPGKGWKNLDYSGTKGKLDKVLYKFIYTTVSTNKPTRKKQLSGSSYEWNNTFALLKILGKSGDPKGIGLTTINEKWTDHTIALEFKKDTGGTLRAVKKGDTKYVSNSECVLIHEGAGNYLVLTKNAEAISYEPFK